MDKIVLKFLNKSTNPNPNFTDNGSSGFDLRAWITRENGGFFDEDQQKFIYILEPLERKLVHTGLYFEIPNDKEVQVRPRSGLALKHGLSILNTPGTVDSSYTGEICIILVNLSNELAYITDGDRIAQGVLCDVNNGYVVELKQIDEITKETERGSGGFGHTGIK